MQPGLDTSFTVWECNATFTINLGVRSEISMAGLKSTFRFENWNGGMVKGGS
jgi:hypothetical protein